MATVGQLIDYLQQLDPNIEVVCYEEEFQGRGDFVDLGFALQEIDLVDMAVDLNQGFGAEAFLGTCREFDD